MASPNNNLNPNENPRTSHRFEYFNNTSGFAVQSIWGMNEAMQIFNCADSHSILLLKLYLAKVGSPSLLYINIFVADPVTELPTGIPLETIAVDPSLFSSGTPVWQIIILPFPIVLSPDTLYVIVLSATGDGSDYVTWGYAPVSFDQSFGTSTDGGNTWTLITSQVGLFEVWGLPAASPQTRQENQMISTTSLGYYCTEQQVYSVTGMNSTIVQKMMGSGKGAIDVSNLIYGYIKLSDQRIRHHMGLPYTIRKEYHVFHFNEQFRQLGPWEDEYEFFDFYDPTDRVEKVFAIYSNKRRLKYPFPKNCDDLTEDITVVSQESSINGKQWTTDDLPRQIQLTFTNSISFTDADIGTTILYGFSENPNVANATPQYRIASFGLGAMGTIVSYDNVDKTCIISTMAIINSVNQLTYTATVNFPAGITINWAYATGASASNTLAEPTSRVGSPPTTTLVQDTSDFMAGRASLKCTVTNETGGVIIFPATRNLSKMQYPWDYFSMWMKTSDPDASFTFRMYDVIGRTIYQQFYCGNNNFNQTLNLNPAIPYTWQTVSLKFMLMNLYAGGVNWVFVPVQYFTIEVDRPCTFWIDNYNWNDGIFFTAPKGYICWSRSEIAAIADEFEVTYSFDPFKQEVPENISIGSAKMAGILLLEYLIGIRQRATAFTQSSDELNTGPDKETLEFTKARLEREVEMFIAEIGFRASTGFGAEG